ncbi:uncharacterized protein LOC117338457 [Pecten maximus]|uniref:uncharacterized protein LOC117338457 n=1 Tax=Pecten maximus TaxID=6579 RepID=UPI0014581167|nr:uncharacterized protein LOC117338457 [Pecten maximus]
MTEMMEDLTLKEMDPEKETLFFQFDASSVPDEMAEVMKSIKELAESMLFHWKTFPIILPSSITEIVEETAVPSAEGEKEEKESKHRGKINFNDLFKAPTFDELDQVAINSAGVLKKLTDRQLQDVWNYGQFEVDSINFPGQVHKWRLTRLLQKGSLTAQDSLLNDMALVLRLLIITARNRFVSHFFSVSNSFRGLGLGFMKILDILIGVPSTTSGDLDGKIQDEHMRYLVAELDIKPHCKKDFQTFCTYVKEKCEQLQADSSKGTPIRPPPIPYCYQTPSGLDIDLRLFNKDLINNCLPILSSILDRGSRGWHVQYRLKLIRELQGKGLTNGEISKRVNASIMDEYLDRVFTAICSNTELENLQQGIGKLLVAQAKTVIAMKKAVNNVQVKMLKHKEKLISHLKSGYRVKSRIEPWMNEQIRAFETEFVEQNLWSAHEEAISICEDGGLKQAVYFLKRDLNFLKQREAVLIKELGKVRHPRRKFTFATRIWLPQNYIVMKKVGNQQERIPTVVLDEESPPNRSLTLSEGERTVSYTVEKLHHRVTSSRYPFWRWWNYLHRTWSWTWNAIFLLGVVIPWCSPVSLRALFGIKPFKPDTTLSQENGKLYRNARSITQTLCSRLSQLWINVWESRKKFEDTPDQGFLGKSFTRHVNRFWNYVLKGACGTVILVLFFPACCVVASTASLTAAITTPLWMPAVTLFVHLSFILVFDCDCPDESNRLFLLFEALVGRIFLQGLVQPIAALLTGGVFCPLAALGVSVFGGLRRTGRGAWDTVMYFTVVKSRGRVPSKDSFMARRIAGPGLASNYFFQIQTEQALAALEARMELDELEAWKSHVTKVIDLPKEKFSLFVEQCFKPFSADIVQEGVYKRLCAETSQYLTDLTMKVKNREKNLNTGLHPDIQRRIKLPERELKLSILNAGKMLEKFYTERVFPKLLMPEVEFWEGKGLEYRDWRGLASKKFIEIFSKTFLIPLEDTDNHFELEVNHINMERYIKMVASGDFHDDLDLVTEIHTPSGEVSAKAPQMDLHFFDPSQVILQTTRYHTPRSRSKPWKPVWKELQFDKLQIPLPIPHPVVIAVLIYNRDHDQNPIAYEDVYCQRILRATKEVKAHAE